MLKVIIISLVTFFVDQAVKYWTVKTIPLHTSLPGIDGIFDFYYIQNTGASWGILSDLTDLLILLSILTIIYIIYLVWKGDRHHWLTTLAFGLILGGAFGNLVDRIRLGYVIDMFRLSFINFPVFNVADFSITLGVILLIIAIVFGFDEEGL